LLKSFSVLRFAVFLELLFTWFYKLIY